LSDGAGLPRPAVNAWVPLPIPAGGIEVDFLWRAERLVVEVDGGAVHSRRRTLERDYDKNLLLDAAGFTVKRFTWRQVTQNGPEVIAAVTRHLQDAWGENRHS
jgi:very-short-patch-repair endonuclease